MKRDEVKRLIKDLPFLHNYRKMIKVNKGWSKDEKFTALDEVIATFSEEQQYDLGVQAGRILKRFHSIPAPDEQENWEQRMLKKFKIHIEKYKASGIKIANDDRALNYIKENIFLTSEGNNFVNGTNLIIDGGMTRKMIYET